MNELSPTKLQPDNTAQVINFPKTAEAMMALKRPHRGMKMFSVDHKTQEVDEVKIKKASLPVKTGQKNKLAKKAQIQLPQTNVHLEVEFVKTKWYGWAINKKNALRQYELHMERVKAFLNSQK